jgi:hypothetical protein
MEMPIEVRNYATMTRSLKNLSSLKGAMKEETHDILKSLKNDKEDVYAVAECLRNEIYGMLSSLEKKKEICNKIQPNRKRYKLLFDQTGDDKIGLIKLPDML